MSDEMRIPIQCDADIVTARQQARRLAMELGFSVTDLTLITTAISEIARNIVEYAKHGEIIMHFVQEGSKRGLTIVARDDGPGIANIAKAMQDSYSTGKGLGLGLPGARRLMDDFDIVSEVGKGTMVRMTKWLR